MSSSTSAPFTPRGLCGRHSDAQSEAQSWGAALAEAVMDKVGMERDMRVDMVIVTRSQGEEHGRNIEPI